jgi:hypothetical protein
METMLQHISKLIRTLLETWLLYEMSGTDTNTFYSNHISHGVVYFQSRVRSKCVLALEKISELFPTNVLECIIEVWFEKNVPRIDMKVTDVLF